MRPSWRPEYKAAYDASRYADPAYRERKLDENAHYKATTAGILSEERHHHRRREGTA